jgi:hypothetical protein
MERKRHKRQMATKITIHSIVINKEKAIYKKPRKQPKPEKQTLDYEDTYTLNHIIQTLPIQKTLQTTFKTNYDTLMTLIHHRLTGTTAMRYTENYYKENYINKLYPNAKITNQEINDSSNNSQTKTSKNNS